MRLVPFLGEMRIRVLHMQFIKVAATYAGSGNRGSVYLYNASPSHRFCFYLLFFFLTLQNLIFRKSLLPDVASAEAPLAVAFPPSRSCLPVGEASVSLLFRPVGCINCIGMSGRLILSLATTTGPTMRATNTISMIKYRVANRITRRFRSLDCLIEYIGGRI